MRDTLLFHYLNAAGVTGYRIRPGYVNTTSTTLTRSEYTSDTCIMVGGWSGAVPPPTHASSQSGARFTAHAHAGRRPAARVPLPRAGGDHRGTGKRSHPTQRPAGTAPSAPES
eukprot:3153890-Prymnesium_polylepis.1